MPNLFQEPPTEYLYLHHLPFAGKNMSYFDHAISPLKTHGEIVEPDENTGPTE